MLSDGFAVYTPGLSEHRNGASLYYANDQLGNLWTVDASGKSQTFYEDTTAFGTMLSTSGSGTTPFKFGGGNGCQTDGDTQMVLMGHRYYDSRTGRFINQDPAKSGGNWYAYCGNNPTNHTDPTGLWCPTPGAWSANGGNSEDQAAAMGQANAMDQQASDFIAGLWATLASRNVTQAAQASSRGAQVKLAVEWLVFPGAVENYSDYAIPVLFDRFHGSQKIFYMLWVPPHTYTDNEDIDFVWVGNDPSAKGGFDWRHILTLTTTDIYDSGNGVGIIGLYRGGLFTGYPFGINPAPYPGNPRKDGIIKSIPESSPIFVGPIVM